MRKVLLYVISFLVLVGLLFLFYWRPKADMNSVTSPAKLEMEEDETPDIMPEPAISIEAEEAGTDAMPKQNDTSAPGILLNEGSAHLEFNAVASLLSHFYDDLKTSKAQGAFSQDGTFNPDIFGNTYKKKLSEQLSADELKDLTKITTDPLMKQFTQAEQVFLSEDGQAKATEFSKKFHSTPPPADRMRLLEDLDAKGQFSANTLATMNNLSSTLQQLTKKSGRQVLTLELVKKGTILRLASTLEGKSNEDVSALTQMIASPVKQKELKIRQESIQETFQSLSH